MVNKEKISKESNYKAELAGPDSKYFIVLLKAISISELKNIS